MLITSDDNVQRVTPKSQKKEAVSNGKKTSKYKSKKCKSEWSGSNRRTRGRHEKCERFLRTIAQTRRMVPGKVKKNMKKSAVQRKMI